MRLIKWILPLIILAGAVFGFVTLKASKPEIPPRTPEERSWTVLATEANPQSLSPQIELYAAIESPRQVTLKSTLNADVSAVAIFEGSHFKAGDLLIRLDTREIDFQLVQQRAQLDSLKAQLNTQLLQHQTNQKALAVEREMYQIAERSLERQSDLSSRNLASREQQDSAEMNLAQRRLNIVSREQAIANHPNQVSQLKASIAQAEAQLASLELDRSRAEVVAPFDGRVNSLSVSAGDRVRNGDLLARIYPTSALEVRAQIPTRILPLIKMNNDTAQTLSAMLELDGRQMALTLDRLSAQVASGSAGVDAMFRFVDTSYAPEPGRTLSLKLNLPVIDNLIPLPPVALYGTDRVYRVVDSRLEAVKVEHYGDRQLSSGEPQVLVRSDALNAGDQIITTQLPNAVSGMLVEVRP